MKRICMIVHQDYYRDGRVRRYAETLAAQDIAVDIICVKPIDPNNKVTQVEVPNVTVYPVDIRRRYGGLASQLREYLIALFFYTFVLLKLHFKHRYDVIHVHNMPDFLVFAALVPRLMGVKILLDIHDPMPEFFMSKYNRSSQSLMYKLLCFEERLSIAFVQKVITANHNFKLNLVKRGIAEEKIFVVHNYPDSKIFNHDKFREVQKVEHFTLIYPGTIAERYALHSAIEAIPLLKQTIPDIRLRIVGQLVDYTKVLKKIAQDLHVEEHLEFIPAVPIEKVAWHIAQAHIGIYTALPDAHMDIATPSKVMEYAFMQIPIIASDISVLRNMFDKNAIALYEPGNVQDFAKKVLELYERPELQEAMVQRMNDTFVRCNSWDNEMQTYNQLGLEMTASAVKAQ